MKAQTHPAYFDMHWLGENRQDLAILTLKAQLDTDEFNL